MTTTIEKTLEMSKFLFYVNSFATIYLGNDARHKRLKAPAKCIILADIVEAAIEQESKNGYKSNGWQDALHFVEQFLYPGSTRVYESLVEDYLSDCD